MAIFSRRTLQRLINENAANFLKKSETKKHINSLNLDKAEYLKLLEEGKNINDLIRVYLNTEWEIVLLNSLSKFGSIVHEQRKGRSKPDVLFTSSKYNFEFLADVTCITGKQDRDNIPLAFKNEFKGIIDKNNLSGYWKVYVNGNSREVDFCRVKSELKLGGKSQREKILNSKQFITFIENVKKSPKINHRFNFKENKENPEPRPVNQIELYKNVIIDISIQYEPRSFYQIEYSQFDDRKIVKFEDDEIYKSLFSKRNQLTKTNYEGCLGVFLCDGIGNTFNRGDLLHHSSRDVIYNFLHNYRELDFVLTVTSESNSYNFYSSEAKIKIVLYQGYGNKLNSEIIHFLENDLVEGFPKPARPVTNARSALKYSFIDKKIMVSSEHCGIIVSSDRVKISSRTLLKLLAGKLPWEKVFYYLGFEGFSSSIPNRFLTMLNDGKLFNEIKIEKGENEKDDDWIVFKFYEDPAISPFKMPDTYK